MLSLEVLIILNHYLVISLAISVTFLHSQICSLYYIYIYPVVMYLILYVILGIR